MISVSKVIDSDIDKLALGFVKSIVYRVTSPQLVALSRVRASHLPSVRFVLCGLDTCVWPSNAHYVTNCLNTFTNLRAMSPNNGGHCQTPVIQSQTTTDAWIKHRRMLEDALKKGKMDITVPVALMFNKTGNHANDKRCVNHPCFFVTSVDHSQGNAWQAASAVSKGLIGPCALIKCTDMIAYDPDSRHGPAARTEQCCGCSAGSTNRCFKKSTCQEFIISEALF